jgi:hypothetical protein
MRKLSAGMTGLVARLSLRRGHGTAQSWLHCLISPPIPRHSIRHLTHYNSVDLAEARPGWRRLHPVTRARRHAKRTEGSPPSVREPRAATLYSVGPMRDPDHEAAMRFSSELRGGRPILSSASKPSDHSGCHHLGSSSASHCASAAGC